MVAKAYRRFVAICLRVRATSAPPKDPGGGFDWRYGDKRDHCRGPRILEPIPARSPKEPG